jgi:predicted nicotinamide N-methyase
MLNLSHRREMLPHDPVELTVELAGGPLALLRPRRPEALIDAVTALDADERLPYWADLWPAALALAAAIDDGSLGPLAGRSTLELGAGLSLASLAAARAGARPCTATDWYEEALEYAAASAVRNGLTLETRPLDWRAIPPGLRADVVLAADVLYERRNAAAVARALEALVAPSGEAWIADQGRSFVPDFLREMSAWSVDRGTRRVASPHLPHRLREGMDIQLFRFRRG